MKKMFTGFALLASLGMSVSAYASPVPKLTTYIESRVAAAERAMQTGPALSGGVELTDYNVDFIAQAGFGVSEVFHLTLYPELDLVFVPTAPAPAQPVAASLQRL